MASQILGVAPNKDMFDDKKIIVETLYTVEWTKYVPAGKRTQGVFKLIGKDFEKFEEKYGIPKGTIEKDCTNINGMSIRTRFNNGYLILLHMEDGDEFDFDSAETYLNALPEDDLRRLIKEAEFKWG